jgi:excisionase family DNA binding protein
MRDGERLLTVQEVARILGCSQQYVRQLLRQGRLPGQKVGRDWVIPEGAVEGLQARRGRPSEWEAVKNRR